MILYTSVDYAHRKHCHFEGTLYKIKQSQAMCLFNLSNMKKERNADTEFCMHVLACTAAARLE